MKGYLSSELGTISIDSEVIARYAGTAAIECFGIVGYGGCKHEGWVSEDFERR